MGNWRSRFLPLSSFPFVVVLILSLTSTLVTGIFFPVPDAEAGADLSTANRRALLSGLPDWSTVGYRGGSALPGANAIGNVIYASDFGVIADDGQDDSDALQRAIDSVKDRAGAGFGNFTLLVLPAGTINISRQITVETSYLIIRGQGADPAGQKATVVVFRPDANTRYDVLTGDGSQPDFSAMTWGSASAGWISPGRGAFRVQVRDVHPSYAGDYSAAPQNRKDFFEGSLNCHWKSGIKLRNGTAGDPFGAHRGDRVIFLDSSCDMTRLQAGVFLWVGAANSVKMYLGQGVTDSAYWDNDHMKTQIFTIAAVDYANHTVTVDRPLEFDLPVDSTSDGSAAIRGSVYYSKVVPLKAVQGVGFEDFSLKQDIMGLPDLSGRTYGLSPSDAVHNYGNLAPEYALHGIVFKWAANCWVKGVHTSMSGSHPIATEAAKNLHFEGNYLDGAWNKGKGGNGYFRGSRVWDSLFYNNTMRNLRHFTLQWSASGNVVIGNDFSNDINLHGGWERNNLVEMNTLMVPFEHAPGYCTVNCGGEGGCSDTGTWYPIYWAAGAKGGKWSGASGPQNVFFNNVLRKQTVQGGSYDDFLPYFATGDGSAGTIFQFGWDRITNGGYGSGWQPLSIGGSILQDWSGNETVNYGADPNGGVNAGRHDPASSLFLMDGSAIAQKLSVPLAVACPSVLNPDGTATIPSLYANGAYYSVTLMRDLSRPDISLRVTGVKDGFPCTVAATLMVKGPNAQVSIPRADYAGASYWARLDYIPTQDGLIWLTVTAGGQINP